MAFKIPWTSSSAQARTNTKQADVSLNDILPTAILRVQLVLLVVLCTDAMRENLTAAFKIKTPPDSPKATISTDAPLLDIGDQQEAPPKDTKLERSDTAYIRNLTLASSEMQSLKTGAIAYFNNWRTSVLRRLGETLKVQPEAVKRAKAQYAVAQEAEATARQSKYYLDMAEVEDLLSARGAPGATKMSDPSSGVFPTKLNELDTKTRALVLNATLFILLSLENYPAHSRILLSHILRSLDLPDDVLISAEVNLALTLQQSTSPWTEPQTQAQLRENSKSTNANSKWKIGLATIAGATLIGVTGGIAAPFLLGAAGAIMGGVGLGGLATLLGATIANPVTVAALFGVLGGRMSGKAMEEYAKEVEDFEIIPITEPPRDVDNTVETASMTATGATKPTDRTDKALSTHMRVAIGISGCLASESDIRQPWSAVSAQNYSVYALRYEPATLLRFGESLDTLLRSSAYTLAQAGAVRLALPALSAALLPVSLLQLGTIVDNPFSIAMSRSDKAGLVLADALTTVRVQGSRPVTLIGVSLGARVVYSCLQELARRRSFGVVENAILIGSPVPSDQGPWMKMRSVVCGRLVNVFTTDDLVLGYMYRVRYAQVGVAGLEAVTTQGGTTMIENVDVTGLVHGHSQYRLAVGQILQRLAFDGIDHDQVAAEEHVLASCNELERQVHATAKQEGRLDGIEDQGGRIVMVDTEDPSPSATAAPGDTDNDQDNNDNVTSAQMHDVEDRADPKQRRQSDATVVTTKSNVDVAEHGILSHRQQRQQEPQQHQPSTSCNPKSRDGDRDKNSNGVVQSGSSKPDGEPNWSAKVPVTKPAATIECGDRNNFSTSDQWDREPKQMLDSADDGHFDHSYEGHEKDHGGDGEEGGVGGGSGSSDDDEDLESKIQMISLDPCPEPNPEPEVKDRGSHHLPTTENVRDGSPHKGFDVS